MLTNFPGLGIFAKAQHHKRAEPMPVQIFVLPLDPSDCPEEWQPDDLDRALPPGLRASVRFVPLSDDGQPRFEANEADAESAANALCSYFGANFRAPEPDTNTPPW